MPFWWRFSVGLGLPTHARRNRRAGGLGSPHFEGRQHFKRKLFNQNGVSCPPISKISSEEDPRTLSKPEGSNPRGSSPKMMAGPPTYRTPATGLFQRHITLQCLQLSMITNDYTMPMNAFLMPSWPCMITCPWSQYELIDSRQWPCVLACRPLTHSKPIHGSEQAGRKGWRPKIPRVCIVRCSRYTNLHTDVGLATCRSTTPSSCSLIWDWLRRVVWYYIPTKSILNYVTFMANLYVVHCPGSTIALPTDRESGP